MKGDFYEKRNQTFTIASAIQILLGVGSLLMTYFLIGESDPTASGVEPQQALGILVLTYAGYAFQVVAGITGLILSKKKFILTVIFGIILFIPQLVTFLHVQGNIALIIVNALLLAIPYYYLHSAYKNYKS